MHNPPQYAVTNYKGMGATHIESLNHLTDNSVVPRYPTGGDYKMHPDGAMYPGKGCRIQDITDGTSHTILCVETMDNSSSVWTYGTDVTLVGLPTTKGTGAIGQFTQSGSGSPAYWAPQGFTGGWTETGQAWHPTPAYTAYRTFLAFNFSPTGADAGTYPTFATNASPTEEADWPPTTPTSNTPNYGPSSGHPTIVNHLMADGSVWSLHKDIDVSAYMFLITKAGGDPRESGRN